MQPHNINMATKEEISSEVNQILGTEIDWSELRKEDLEEFRVMMDDPELLEVLFKHHAKDMSKRQLENLVDGWYPGKYAGRML